MFTLRPIIPLAIWVPSAIVAVVVFIIYARAIRSRLEVGRWRIVLALTAIVVAAPLICILNPTWVAEIPPPPGKPTFTVLVDSSISMNVKDHVQGSSPPTNRYDAAMEIAKRFQGALTEKYDIRYRTFDISDRSAPSIEKLVDSVPTGAGTNLVGAMENAVRDGANGQAILLLTDGAHNGDGDGNELRRVAEKARALAIPVYSVAMGSAGGVDDLQIRARVSQETAFVKQTIPIIADVQQRGDLTRQVEVELSLDGEVVDSKVVSVEPNSSSAVSFDVEHSATNAFRYELGVAPLPAEATAVNNRSVVMLRVIDEPTRVLLLEGKPYWDTKFLMRTLASDASIALTSVIRMTDSRYVERRMVREIAPADDANTSDPAGPVADADSTETTGDVAAESDNENAGPENAGPENAGPEVSFRQEWSVRESATSVLTEILADYQVVVLGREAEVYLDVDSMEQLRKWVASGDGALVCARGAPASQLNQRLRDMMPLRWSPTNEQRFRVQWTDSGNSLKWLGVTDSDEPLGNLPSLASVTSTDGMKPLTVVLASSSAEKDAVPVISYQPFGTGRVVVVEGAGMWRWAFLAPEYQVHDAVYGQLWRGMLRWIVTNSGLQADQKAALRADKVTYRVDEVAMASLIARPGIPQDELVVHLTGPAIDGERTVKPVPTADGASQFRVVFGKLPEGVYRASLKGSDDPRAVALFDVRSNLTEQLDVAVRTDVLKLFAERTGGAVLTNGSPEEVSEKFDEHLSSIRPVRLTAKSSWDRWWILLGVLVCMGTNWGIRRSAGLI